jgi:glycine receptor alpha-3
MVTIKLKIVCLAGNSRLTCQILFERSIGYYLIQVYIPACLIVIISWIPFWLDKQDSHAKVALGVTTVLTITTLITSTNDSLPKISYIKSIDVFLEFCFLMVFAALLEYAFVGYMLKSDAMKRSRSNQIRNNGHKKCYDSVSL